MANRKLKANGTIFYLMFTIITIVSLVFGLGIQSWVYLMGNIAYGFLLIPVFFLSIIYIIRKSAVIILKDGFIVVDAEQEILELKNIISVYEKEELKNSPSRSGAVTYFYLCFEKENGEVLQLNILNYSKEDRDYLYKYVEHYGLNIKKIDSTMLKII